MKKQIFALKALLDGKEELIAHLPPAQQEALAAADATSPSLNPFTTPIWEALSPVHYSWIDPLVTDGAVRSALRTPLAPPLRAHLLGDLYRKLGMSKAIPIEQLPDHSLNVLLQLDKKQLVRLTAHAGLQDLAGEMRKTVDKRAIERIEQFLTSGQRQTLHRYMRASDPQAGQVQGLEAWSQSKEHLLFLLQQAGLRRLGLALAHAERSLLWHLVHRLDKGRGQWVVRAARQEIKPRIGERLAQQLLELASELKLLER